MHPPWSFLPILMTFAAGQIIDAQRMEVKSDYHSILYQSGYEKDAQFTRTWLDRAEDLLKTKYGVPYSFYVSFYLNPAHSGLR